MAKFLNRTACFKKCKLLFEYQHLLLLRDMSSLYYKHIAITNYNSSIINRLGASLTDNARVIIYDRHIFIEQATGGESSNLYLNVVHFSTHVLIRHLWQLETVVLLHCCSISKKCTLENCSFTKLESFF